MNFLAAIWNFLTEPKHRNNYELQHLESDLVNFESVQEEIQKKTQI